jgi:hypothetical protein
MLIKTSGQDADLQTESCLQIKIQQLVTRISQESRIEINEECFKKAGSSCTWDGFDIITTQP